MKEKLKKIIQFILNPNLLFCLLVAWMITNGWAYVFVGIGTYNEIPWMVAIGGTYIAFLWLPISAEKIITVAIAIALLRWRYPDDQKTLAILEQLYDKAKNAIKNGRKKKSKLQDDVIDE